MNAIPYDEQHTPYDLCDGVHTYSELVLAALLNREKIEKYPFGEMHVRYFDLLVPIIVNGMELYAAVNRENKIAMGVYIEKNDVLVNTAYYSIVRMEGEPLPRFFDG